LPHRLQAGLPGEAIFRWLIVGNQARSTEPRAKNAGSFLSSQIVGESMPWFLNETILYKICGDGRYAGDRGRITNLACSADNKNAFSS